MCLALTGLSANVEHPRSRGGGLNRPLPLIPGVVRLKIRKDLEPPSKDPGLFHLAPSAAPWHALVELYQLVQAGKSGRLTQVPAHIPDVPKGQVPPLQGQ